MNFTYSQATQFFDGLTNLENLSSERYSLAHLNLEKMRNLLERLGNPERKFPTIHVAGTKGKGSTAAFIASILQAQGRKVGLYTSPQLHSIRERIQINRTLISQETFAFLTSSIRKFGSINADSFQSHFEVLTALCFLYFARKNVEIAVIEAGMGGRVDATNVITPLVSVITSISLDHTKILGNSLDIIAQEKAGIIKQNGTLVSAPQTPEVLEILKNECTRCSANFIFPGKTRVYEKTYGDLFGQTLVFRSLDNGKKEEISGASDSESFWTPLLGDFQIENASVAVEAILALRLNGINIPMKAIKEGLKQVQWPGRLQIISNNPAIIVDGAHNPYSASQLRKALMQIFKKSKLLIIFGASIDKDIPGIIAELTPVSKKIILTRSEHPRAAPIDFVCKAIQNLKIPVFKAENITHALDLALKLSKTKNPICITGSLFLVGEALRALDKNIEDI